MNAKKESNFEKLLKTVYYNQIELYTIRFVTHNFKLFKKNKIE